MLKKQHRLTSDFEYKVTRKYGNKYNFNLFNLVVCKPLNYEGPVKVGFVVGTTYHKSAVKRNRVKRLFRQAFLEAMESLPNNYWLAVYPKASCLQNDNYEIISTEINKALSTIPFTR